MTPRVARPKHRAPGRIESVAVTMIMARFYAEKPVPEVYAWYADDDHPVGVPRESSLGCNGKTFRRKIVRWVLDELATYHAKFAKHLPFQGFGSIYCSDAPSDAQPSFGNASAYRLVPLLPGP